MKRVQRLMFIAESSADLQEDLFPDVLEGVFDFRDLGAHGVVQRREVDRVAPVVVDGNTIRQVHNLMIPSAGSKNKGPTSIMCSKTIVALHSHEYGLSFFLFDDYRSCLCEFWKFGHVDVPDIVNAHVPLLHV